MEYLDYSVEDFLVDEPFQQWVLSPDSKSNLFWEHFLRTHPEKKGVVLQAREILKSMAIQEIPVVEDQQIDKLWQRIESSRKSSFPAIPPVTTKKLHPKHRWIWPQFELVAAVFIGVLICAICYYTFFKPVDFVVHRTAYGQTKTITLPDKSTVILNSHSSIRYASSWGEDEIRQVWVEGEAFFSVVHTQNHQKFLVNTPSSMAVEVLGTQFNVKNRQSGTRVVLKSGKVKLLLNQNTKEKQIVMAPNESVELTKTAAGYIKKQVDAQQYISWTKNKLIFKNTTIAEIKTLLEETYGLIVRIPDKNLLNQRISGSVPSNNIESLLFALSESFNYQIVQENHQLIFLEKSLNK